MFESILVGVICLYIAKRIFLRSTYDVHAELQRLQADNDRLSAFHKQNIATIEQLLNEKQENLIRRSTTGSVNELVVFDALAREKRATSALTAVLRAQGCTQVQIDEVLKTIENVQPGDAQ
jgi:hypothetical protein